MLVHPEMAAAFLLVGGIEEAVEAAKKMELTV